MPAKKHLIVIGGPTAVGKTGLAIRLANYFGVEIISADSRQFYREMNIGTAKPSSTELAQAPHHFINNLSIEETYSVGDYEREVLARLEQLMEAYDVAILVGGSGLFIRAVCEGLDEFPDVPKKIRNKISREYEEKGLEFLQKKLLNLDKSYYPKVDLNNPHRLIRALSVIEASGQPFSNFLNQSPQQRPFKPIYLALEIKREKLYQRINQRVDQMMKKGLLEEAKSLYPQQQLNALQTVGYEELFAYLEGKTTLKEAVELIKRNSRRYAKRQMTWFRKRTHWARFAADDLDGIKAFIKKQLLDDL